MPIKKYLLPKIFAFSMLFKISVYFWLVTTDIPFANSCLCLLNKFCETTFESQFSWYLTTVVAKILLELGQAKQ